MLIINETRGIQVFLTQRFKTVKLIIKYFTLHSVINYRHNLKKKHVVETNSFTRNKQLRPDAM